MVWKSREVAEDGICKLSHKSRIEEPGTSLYYAGVA